MHLKELLALRFFKPAWLRTEKEGRKDDDDDDDDDEGEDEEGAWVKQSLGGLMISPSFLLGQIMKNELLLLVHLSVCLSVCSVSCSSSLPPTSADRSISCSPSVRMSN